MLKQGDQVIEYCSRALTAPERGYSTVEKECLAILHALKIYRHYLLGRHFTVFTDHCPLTFLNSQRVDSHGRLGRWRLLLQEFTFTIKYTKGVDNVEADGLSRMHETRCVAVGASATELQPKVSNLEMRQAQLSAPRLIIAALKDNAVASPRWSDSSLRHFSRIRGKLRLQDGLLCRAFNDAAGPREVPVIPETIRRQFLTDFHDGIGGHFGPEKMADTLKQVAYWPGLQSDAVNFCQECETCQLKKAQLRPAAPLGEMPIGKPW